MKTKIAGVELDGYVLNAAGVNDTTLEELEAIAKSESSAVVMKSCTINPRDGNEEPRYARTDFGAIQAMGLPNLGYMEYARFASLLKRYGKPVIASVAGLCVEDYRVMVREFQRSDVDLIEVNLSCPNVELKEIIGYDFNSVERILACVCEHGKKPIGLKLPPYFCEKQYRSIANLVPEYSISFVSCINSLGNCLVIDAEEEKAVLKPRNGFGGLCGDYIKPIALANVRRFYEIFNGRVSIFGVGGVKSGRDAFEFLLAGADAVQAGTVFEKEGVSCFARINAELGEILERKGYSCVEDVKGRLRYL